MHAFLAVSHGDVIGRRIGAILLYDLPLPVHRANGRFSFSARLFHGTLRLTLGPKDQRPSGYAIRRPTPTSMPKSKRGLASARGYALPVALIHGALSESTSAGWVCSCIPRA